MPKEEERRPDPQELLQRIHRENRGRLTVFLGAAAGVGKTYTMLEAAHSRLAEGVQVAVGWVETHDRAETGKLLERLPRIAPKVLEYRGRILTEMDIDAILAQRPALVLVDELAHTNVEGSRHIRRFQDVGELLNAGIDVYTTLNIQHIESLNDVVAQITGIIVRETVPDFFVEQADSIQLIDIPPEDLIKRLKDGKVYISGQVQQALKSFFRPGNINALRELALRFTAGRVDQDMAEYMRLHRINGPWPAAGRVMVCISASPFSAQLIRAAHRLAKGLRADFLAVYIDTPSRRFPMGEKEQDRVWRNLRLAEELGGKIVTVAGNNIVGEILTVARNENVTAVVIGKPRHSRWREFWQGSLVDKLIRRSEGINIYVIQSKAETEAHSAISTAQPDAPAASWRPVAEGLLMTAAVTMLSWLGREHFDPVNTALLYVLPILFSAVRWGRRPSYITALASVLAFNFLFTPPLLTFTVSDVRYLLSFSIFLVISFVVGGRTETLRKEVRLTRQRETSVRTLYDFSRQIAAIIDVTRIAQTFVRHVGVAIGRNTVLLLPDDKGQLAAEAHYDVSGPAGQAAQPALPAAEQAVANWVWANGQVAGRSTETLPGAEFLFVPLTVDRRMAGVFGIEMGQQKMTQEERQLIYAWAGLAAIAVERGNLTEAARQAALLKESEQLRTALFNSVSHELRTPLAAISAAAAALLDTEAHYSAEIRRELLETVKDSANRMERVVGNLLDTARIESGMLELKIDWCDVEDIVGTAIRRMGETTQNYLLRTRISPELPLLRADCVLLEHVLVNLLDNAVKYSPPGAEIIIAAVQSGPEIVVSVQDSGSGIPEQDMEKIFEKFYRARQAVQAAGTGLGLSICKSIVEAHRGRIWARNGPGGGAVVAFTVPVPEDGGKTLVKEAEWNDGKGTQNFSD
ncbi:sensor histidine kinase [Acetonema longum]|uniref:histidine kinase n=1 Tax=Acetonema longum DSM 6540 TaxID=1009370 RepID=F7NIN3_9FIRM|nr:sensor histidine kinase KdpD [Acetonema longum]EGO64097.1 Osmosensitive K channel His kinase sensor [Acetonema longum DSM 6540]